MEYKNLQEAVGELFLSPYWSEVKDCDKLLVASAMFAQGLQADEAKSAFPNQFKVGEE